MKPVSKRSGGWESPRGRRPRVVVVSGPPADIRDSYEKIQWALNIVLEESERNGGLYPPLARRPRLSNVLVRAGLPRTFLEKRNEVPNERDKRNAKLKEEINARLGTKAKITIVVAAVPEAVSESALVRILKADRHEAELNLVQMRAENSSLRAKLKTIEEENRSLRREIALLKKQ